MNSMLTIDTTEGDAATPFEVGLSKPASTEGNSKRPPLFVSADELFFWTTSWLTGEAEAAADRAAGNVRTFDSTRELLEWLAMDDDD